MTKAMPFLQKAILLSYDPRRFQTAFFFLKWGIAFYRKSWYKISSIIDLSAQERKEP